MYVKSSLCAGTESGHAPLPPFFLLLEPARTMVLSGKQLSGTEEEWLSFIYSLLEKGGLVVLLITRPETQASSSPTGTRREPRAINARDTVCRATSDPTDGHIFPFSLLN